MFACKIHKPNTNIITSTNLLCNFVEDIECSFISQSTLWFRSSNCTSAWWRRSHIRKHLKDQNSKSSWILEKSGSSLLCPRQCIQIQASNSQMLYSDIKDDHVFKKRGNSTPCLCQCVLESGKEPIYCTGWFHNVFRQVVKVKFWINNS